ncbi:MAG TPA: HIT family protein [Arcobacter sp.]|nr:HIT family protein [Arcobacter sp.]
MKIYENNLVWVEIHESEVPWLKVFTQAVKKEFSECTSDEKQMIWDVLDVIEKEMLAYYKPEKINIASFGNMLPHVHWHISARFKEDSYFPEPMWGEKQRDSNVVMKNRDLFIENVVNRLKEIAS